MAGQVLVCTSGSGTPCPSGTSARIPASRCQRASFALPDYEEPQKTGLLLMVKDREDDPFRPKLGKPRARGGKAAKSFLNRVLSVAARAGPGFSARTGHVQRRGMSSSFGRGVSTVRAMANRRSFSSHRNRRVIVKARIAKLAGKGMGTARAHVRYIQRHGVGKDGEKGKLYNGVSDDVDGEAFVKRGENDRHQFRFIVSAEDADQLQDLKAFTRDLMQQMAEDLGTEIDWVAVNHHNTAHPHTHIVVRGVDDQGNDLVIAPDYISYGLRRRASELVTLELGPQTDLEIQQNLHREVEQDRFTGLDRQILKVASAGEIDMRVVDIRYDPERGYDRFKHSLLMGRLEKLSRVGLAQETETGLWQLSEDMEERLRGLGERGDILKEMFRDMRQAGLDRLITDYAIFDPEAESGKTLVGRVVAVGLSNELYDRFYILVDGVDGRVHHVDIGYRNEDDDLAPGVTVEVRAKSAGPREVDRTIDRIARAAGGAYSIDAHLEQEKRDTAAFAETHVRRLEYLRRAGKVERRADGSWEIPSDYLERAAAFEEQQKKRFPLDVSVQSTFTLEQQITAEGATWLDRRLLARKPSSRSSVGFGLEVEQALEQRRDYLVEQGLAERRGSRVLYQRNLLDTLRARELTSVADQISKELALPYQPAKDRAHIAGIYRRPLRLASGKYALIERARDFTLVPWRPVLERNRGKAVSGIVRGQSISWTLTKQRGLGIG